MIEFRTAHAADLKSVVRTHSRAFAGFFLTRLGPRFLLKYYRLILEHPGGILVIATDKEAVAGFVAGFSDPAGFYYAMKKGKLSFALSVLPTLLSSPTILKRLLIDFREVRAQARPSLIREAGVGELSSIGVDPTHSGRGIGRGLLAAFIADSRKRGLTKISLTTDADGNDAVNQFYIKAGFYLERAFIQRDGRRMNEYQMSIL